VTPILQQKSYEQVFFAVVIASGVNVVSARLVR